MSNLTHTLYVVGAGVLAFGAVFASHQLTAPLVEPTVHESGQEDAVDDRAGDDELGEAPMPDPSEALLEQAILGRWQAPEPANQDAFVEFTQYGLWFSSDGCNGLNGSWIAAEDGTLTIDGTEAMTMIACDNEPIPTAVRYAVSAEVTPAGELVLTNEEGEQTALVQARRGSISLQGRWAPEESTGGSYVEFTADGRWEGSDGCNAASGSWELTAADSEANSADGSDTSGSSPQSFGRLVIGDLSGMTRMACEDLDSVSLPLVLADAVGLEFTDQNRATLLVTQPDADESEFVLLQRADEGEPVIVVP